MKKIITLAFAGGLALSCAVLGSASADPVPVGTPFGGASVTAAEGGHVLLVDGDSTNSDPFRASDGYIGVNEHGLQCSDDGDGYDRQDLNNDGDTTDEGETTATDDGCPA